MSTQIQLCNKLDRLPVYNAQYDNSGNIVPKANKNWISIPEVTGKFIEEGVNNDGGNIWKQMLDINCEISNADVIDIAMVPHIYRISFSDGTTCIYGSIEIPVISPKIKGIKAQKQISFERISLSSEF